MKAKLQFTMDYKEYMDRYSMFCLDEEMAEQAPPLMTEEEFEEKKLLIIDCYRTYNDFISEGKEHEASMYMINMIAPLEEMLLL
ncbi:hypothetical protein [Desertibacillus haloalkaliphilus]|uniref:hypothetical protein n=1 Tax=Desertibacillus haloalkaliphilus TaxID=1328930 RepID=UPI001C25C2C4|nr:hypothetical protein [Desertibacillus haloalkaliphilus]MBU8908822.1 hypothetical protein [Desertibacillus haloalkaliphilus]